MKTGVWYVHMRLLIIEDDAAIAFSVKNALESQGYAVDHLPDGERGAQRLGLYHESYDAVVLDVSLPGKSGIVVCREARQRGITTPVLMLTGLDGVEDRVHGLDAGADDYLVKPFALDELLARLRALTRRQPLVHGTELAAGPLRLNTATRRVTACGEDLNLTLKEFAVLEYLLRHAGKVVSREELIDHAWDFNGGTFSNTVDVHVSRIRRKLGDAAACLESIKGVGYRLSEV